MLFCFHHRQLFFDSNMDSETSDRDLSVLALCVWETEDMVLFYFIMSISVPFVPVRVTLLLPASVAAAGKNEDHTLEQKGQASCGSTHRNTSFHDSVFNLTEGKEQKMAPGIWKLQITKQNHSTSLSWKWLFGLKTMCHCCQFPSNSFYTVPCYLLVFCTKLHSRLLFNTSHCGSTAGSVISHFFAGLKRSVSITYLWP